MCNKLLKDIIKIREVLEAKVRNIKWNQIQNANLLKDTFQRITKPLKRIIKKLDNKNSTPLTSSFTNDSIENHNNGGDEGADDDGELNNEINDVNNIEIIIMLRLRQIMMLRWIIMILRCLLFIHYQIIDINQTEEKEEILKQIY
uniref:Uncharacterized protein n=1 Tax=Glossina palpalis gambiensis TaxID=67801 RepID=A0A1B0BID8_9MUSC